MSKRVRNKAKEEELARQILEIQNKIENNKDKSNPRQKVTKKELAILSLYRIEQDKQKTKEKIKEQDVKDERKIKNNLSRIIKIATNEFKLEVLKEHKGYFLMWGLLEELSRKPHDEIEKLIKKGKEILIINNLENPVLRTEKEEE